jgi:DNA-binding MarR family transcriptional regulator
MPKTNHTEDEAASIKTLMAALEPFRAHNPTMPLQLAFTFLLVAANPGRAVTDYARMAGMTPGVMARNLLDLGDYNRRREPGLMLVQEQIDPMDRRVHRKVLTHKGRALVGAVHRALSHTVKMLLYVGVPAMCSSLFATSWTPLLRNF